MAGIRNFSVIKGDTFFKALTMRRKTTKVPINLTGATISGTAAGIALTCSVTNGPAGQCSFGLSASQTDNLREGVHQIEVVCTYADSTVQTLIRGNFVIVA